MNPEAMGPFGSALSAFLRGDRDAELILRRDDGLVVPMQMAAFFRGPGEFSDIETTALHYCTGRVLDGGAGSGLHTLQLQARGLHVTAVDVNRQVVAVMTERGVLNALEADLTTFNGGPFETLLLLGHGLGMVGDLDGLRKFLKHALQVVAPGGQVLIHSTDVRMTDDAVHLAYHETNRQKGRYIGQSRLWLEFARNIGPQGLHYRWLLVDPETLLEYAGVAGWSCEILRQEDSGEYLARLTEQQSSRA